MRSDPFHDEPTSVEQRRVPPPILPPMEELQPRQVAPPPAPSPPAGPPPAMMEPGQPAGGGEERTDEAQTLIFAIGKFKDFLLWFLGVLEVTLLLRFIFRLINADPGNAFAGLLYAITDIILLPFNGIVKTNWAFEWPTLIAMAVYALIFVAITSFLRLLISTPKEPE